MIIKKKMTSAIVRRSSAILLILFSISLVSHVYAFGDIFGGILIQATPFDFKLSETGFFNLNRPDSQIFSTAPAESMESLFMKARSFRYVHNADTNQWQSPEETEMKHTGDCKDKAVWLYAQLKHNGYAHVRLVVGRYRSFDKIFHAWVVCADSSNTIYLLDPAIQKHVWRNDRFIPGFYQPVYSFDGQNRYRYVAS